MIKKAFLFSLLVCLCTLLQAQSGANTIGRRWYLGVDGGVSFGHATFRSFDADKTRVGFTGGLFAGYRINSFLSTELEAAYRSVGMGSPN